MAPKRTTNAPRSRKFPILSYRNPGALRARNAMPSSVGAYLRSLSARTMERRQTASWWSKEYPLVDGRSENDDESCDARQPAGGTNILQSFEGLGFNENSKCAKHPPENLLLPGSWCFQLNGPPPPFEAFLFHGTKLSSSTLLYSS